MGIHIVIQDKNGDRHPSWDWIRYSNDREFMTLLHRSTILDIVADKEYGDAIGYRPIDAEFASLRDRIKVEEYSNEARYLELCDILEHDKRWFIRGAW